MTRTLISITFLLWLSPSGADNVQNPFYYKVTSMSGAVSYMLGTIHVGVSLDEFPTTIKTQIKASRLVMTERYRSAQWIESYYRDPASVLKRESPKMRPISVEHSAQLQAAGVPEKLLSMFDDRDCWTAIRFRTKWFFPFMDLEVMREAHRAGQSLEELEDGTVLEKADELDGEPDCSIEEIANEYGLEKYLAESDLDIYKMLASYRAGDENMFGNSDNPGMSYRNHHWLAKLVVELNRGGAFVAVGAAHLKGKQGLVELLRAHDFIVESVSF